MTLTFGLPNVRPIGLAFDQASANRVLPNVVRFFSEALVVTQPVIEKIPLPLDANRPGNVFLPFTYNLCHRFVRWKRGQGMQMIRHQKQEVHPPIATLMEDTNRIENVCC